jgi:citrate synthase
MNETTWKTAITKIEPNEVRLRGYRIDELMGEITFAQSIFLALKSELPPADVAKLLDAMLVSSIDHGATPPSTIAARTAVSTGAPLNAALAAGVLSINRYHGAAIYDCMGVLEEGLRLVKESHKDMETIAVELLAEYREKKKRIAGFGHRIHSSDPRTAKLFSLAKELGVADEGVAMMKAIRKAFKETGKDLPINVDGAIAALLIDLEMPRELANAFFIMARVPGLVAHIYEEQTRERPMRRIHPSDHTYDGPASRDLS